MRVRMAFFFSSSSRLGLSAPDFAALLLGWAQKGYPKRPKEAPNGSRIAPKWLPSNLKFEGFNLKVETCTKDELLSTHWGPKCFPNESFGAAAALSAPAFSVATSSEAAPKIASKSLGPLPQGGQYERDRTLKRSQRKSARRKACRRVRDEVPQCPPLRLLHPAREAGAPVHGTGIALHGDKEQSKGSVRDREVKSPRDGDQAFIKSWQKLEAQRRSSN